MFRVTSMSQCCTSSARADNSLKSSENIECQSVEAFFQQSWREKVPFDPLISLLLFLGGDMCFNFNRFLLVVLYL